MEGDPQARFRAFFEDHYEQVLAYALRRVGDAAAEDVVADAFLVAWRRFDDIPDDPLPWLFTVTRNVAANHRRGTVRREMFLSRLRGEPGGRSGDPGEEVATRADILAAFRSLSHRDQETLALVAWEGLSAARAAKVLGCSVGAFWVRLHRARRRLARELEGAQDRNAQNEPLTLVDPMEVEQG